LFLCCGGWMRTPRGSTMSRFCKRSTAKSSGMPRRHHVPRESRVCTRKIKHPNGVFCFYVAVIRIYHMSSRVLVHVYLIIVCLNHCSWKAVFCSIYSFVGFCPSGTTISLSSLSFVR